MAKFSGKVGFTGIQQETSPGVWERKLVERRMRGDVIRLSKNTLPTDRLADDIKLSHRISVVADKFSYENFVNITWIEYMGVKWKVTSVEVERPRLVISVGGVYNE